MDDLKRWDDWNHEFEIANYEKVWAYKEVELQDSLRTSAENRLRRAERPAFVAELLAVEQVS